MKNVGEQAAEISHQIVLKHCSDAGLTVPRVLKEISDAINAEEVKVAYSPTEGSWQYSKKIKAWQVRQKAIDQAVAILGIKAPEKQDIKTSGNLVFRVEYEKKRLPEIGDSEDNSNDAENSELPEVVDGE